MRERKREGARRLQKEREACVGTKKEGEKAWLSVPSQYSSITVVTRQATERERDSE